MAKQCELIIGYLLPRRCEEKAIDACSKCGRATCDLHMRVGDSGLLCRDCYEGRAAVAPEELTPLPQPVRQSIYRRWDYTNDADYLLFDTEDESDTFSTLS
jgi:hypothetical protein